MELWTHIYICAHRRKYLGNNFSEKLCVVYLRQIDYLQSTRNAGKAKVNLKQDIIKDHRTDVFVPF